MLKTLTQEGVVIQLRFRPMGSGACYFEGPIETGSLQIKTFYLLRIGQQLRAQRLQHHLSTQQVQDQ